MSEKRKIPKVFEGINLNNNIAVLKRLKEFRSDGQAEQLHEVIEVLNKTENEEIQKNILQILNDLKDKTIIPFLIHEIDKEKNKNIQHYLVSACWQNGLDYGDYFVFFIDLMIKCNYLTAVETFTVIEVMETNLTIELLDESINKLKDALKDFEEDKQYLVKELIYHLSTKKMAG